MAQKTVARATLGTGSRKPRKTMPAVDGVAPSVVNITMPAGQAVPAKLQQAPAAAFKRAPALKSTAAFKKEWVENAPFYLDGILETQATLTEEEKEALHLALQG